MPQMTVDRKNGKTRVLCGAPTKGTGKPCTQPAGWGTGHPGVGHCKRHLGNTPAHAKAAAVAEARAMGYPIDVTPNEALIHCVRVAAGEVHYCSLQIQELELKDVVVTHQSTKKGVEKSELTDLEETSNAAELNIWIRARHEAMDRLARYSKMALDAGVAERTVRLAEQWAEQIAPAFKLLLDGLGLTKAQEKKAPQLVRAAVQSLEAQSTELVEQ